MGMNMNKKPPFKNDGMILDEFMRNVRPDLPASIKEIIQSGAPFNRYVGDKVQQTAIEGDLVVTRAFLGGAEIYSKPKALFFA